LQKAAKRAGVRVQGWCEPADIALCVVREHLAEQMAATFVGRVHTLRRAPNHEVQTV
jgi:hypothetical protein